MTPDMARLREELRELLELSAKAYPSLALTNAAVNFIRTHGPSLAALLAARDGGEVDDDTIADLLQDAVCDDGGRLTPASLKRHLAKQGLAILAALPEAERVMESDEYAAKLLANALANAEARLAAADRVIAAAEAEAREHKAEVERLRGVMEAVADETAATWVKDRIRAALDTDRAVLAASREG